MTAFLAALMALQAPESSERNSEIVAKLDTMTLDIGFDETPFEEAVAYFRDVTGLNFVIAAGAAEKVTGKITLKLKGVRARSALKLMLAPHGLGAMVRDGLIEITTKEKLNYNVVLRVYDVRDLFMKINNFPGPRLELTPPGAGPGIAFTPEEPMPDRVTRDSLPDMVKEMVGSKSDWDDNPNARIAVAPNGMLMVTQTKKVQEEVERLVNMLRELR